MFIDKKFTSILFIAIFSCVNFVFAYDFSTADEYFAKRGNSEKDVVQAKNHYEKALSQVSGRELVYAVEQLARLSYLHGDLLTPEEDSDKREEIFSKCMEYTQHIHPDKVGPNGAYYYWQNTCLALWGKAVGQFKAFFKVGQIKENLKMGMQTNPSYEGGGIYRLAAAIYIKSKAMSLLGLYDPDLALTYVNDAISMGPDYYNAYLLKAEVLMELDRQADAVKLLKNTKKLMKKMMQRDRLPKGREVESKILYQKLNAVLNKLS